MYEFLSADIVRWVVLPAVIFFARIVDVSLGTARIIMISKGRKELATFIGFFEITVWLLISAKVISSLDNIFFLIAYSGGFAVGNYVGMMIDERLALGKISVRLIVNTEPFNFIEVLKDHGYGVTFIEANGTRGKAYIIYSIMKRNYFEKFDRLVMDHHPKAFISVEEVKSAKEGVFHPSESIIDVRKMMPARKIK